MIPVYEALQGKTDDHLKKGEYRNEDGLIYCEHCHSPKQVCVPLGDKIIRPRAMCKCEELERDRKDTEWKAKQAREEVERNRYIGIQDPKLLEYTFANDKGYNANTMKIAREYCEHWTEMKKNGIGMTLWGDVGTGKSFIAGCIANELLDQGVRVLVTNFSRLLNRLTDLQMGDRNSYIDSLNAYALLVIDDLGIERNSEFAKEQCFGIVDGRYRSGLPMIVTTNLTFNEMIKPGDMWRKRIFDRVLERGTMICVNEQNIREINKKNNMEQVKALLLNGDQQPRN